MKAYSRDRVRLSDGREGVIRGYRLHVGAGESSEEYKVLFEDGTTEHVPSHRVTEVIEVGPHDYRRGEQRGHCDRCGIRKRDHRSLNTARGLEGTWA